MNMYSELVGHLDSAGEWIPKYFTFISVCTFGQLRLIAVLTPRSMQAGLAECILATLG